ncbi:MAG TPA: hypothetical protein VG538_11525 [Vicinamibacterales bacterium]|jgi:hypothetical protein|nr:hypothetical protein [Vicinamibacterales bacterium]
MAKINNDEGPLDSRDPLLRADIKRIARLANEIYEAVRPQLQRTHSGQFAAIDIVSGTISTDRFPEKALEAARAKNPDGVFHLVKIGADAAFRNFMFHARRVRAL